MSKRRTLQAAVVTAAQTYVHTQQGYAALHDAVEALDEHLTPIGPDVGAYGTNSPDTSKKAAHQARLLQGSIRQRIVSEIFAEIHQAPDMQGYTDDELERLLHAPHTTVSSARNWLVNNGWLTDSGYRRKTTSGRDAIVWKITTAAYDHLRYNT